MAKAGSSKSGQAKSQARRASVGRPRSDGWRIWRQIVTNPAYLWGALICFGAFVTISMIAIWSRERIIVQPEQVMSNTRIARVDFRVADESSTDIKRDEARKAAPQVYELNNLYLDRFAGQLNGLPKAVAGKATVAEISAELQEEFRLTDQALTALQSYAVDGATTVRWQNFVEELVNQVLPRNPLLTSEEYQTHWAAREYSATLKRVVIQDGEETELSGDAIELIRDPSGELERRIERLVQKAGFPTDVSPYITAKILSDLKPTLIYDAEATSRLADEAAASVPTQYSQYRWKDVLYLRGDTLSPSQFEKLLAEREAFYDSASAWRIWSPRIGTAGLICLCVVLFSLFIARFEPRIARNPLRVLAISTTMSGMLLITAVVAPSLLYLAAIAPALFVTVVLLVAYDQKLAALATLAQSAFVALALGLGVGWVLLLLAGCGAMISQLRELRNRNSLIRAAIVTAAVFGAGTILLGLYEMPMTVAASMRQILQGALWTVAGSFGVAFVVMGILPGIERLFGITTGMTLAELRDPKQPLLRQLQQKAPGTYNHSLQVANIAEAAAEAIGADGLLVYVGALYHDVGKMNKPEYFIENQIDGYNKHEKLSPAMSLLVIVGHVKDGIELAREYNLPRSIIHFVESHHGTTLVEYFYHAARTQAAEEPDKETVEEVRFRYPGPRPQTKEAAILMLSDAVESATRAMKEPNPSRIESLVRELSHKRMLDGQFDLCDLTFRELTQIEDAIISRVCAIHHGRISYPSSARTTDAPAKPQPSTLTAGERQEAARSA